MLHTHTPAPHPLPYLPNYFSKALLTNNRNTLFCSYEIITFLPKQLDVSYITLEGSENYDQTAQMSV